MSFSAKTTIEDAKSSNMIMDNAQQQEHDQGNDGITHDEEMVMATKKKFRPADCRILDNI